MSNSCQVSNVQTQEVLKNVTSPDVGNVQLSDIVNQQCGYKTRLEHVCFICCIVTSNLGGRHTCLPLSTALYPLPE